MQVGVEGANTGFFTNKDKAIEGGKQTLILFDFDMEAVGVGKGENAALGHAAGSEAGLHGVEQAGIRRGQGHRFQIDLVPVGG